MFKKFAALLLVFISPLIAMENKFGGWAIDKECYNYICDVVQEGETIVELGTGYSTRMLSENFNVFTIEHNKEFLDRYKGTIDKGNYPVHFILAPLTNIGGDKVWYNPEILKAKLPKKSALVLVDGPCGAIDRRGFLNYVHLFQNTKVIVFDDVDREMDLETMKSVAKKLGRKYKVYKNGAKAFGVVFMK